MMLRLADMPRGTEARHREPKQWHDAARRLLNLSFFREVPDLIAWSFEYARTRLDAVDRARRRRSDGYLVKDDRGVPP